MKSLAQQPWIFPAGSALLAIFVPVWVLWPPRQEVDLPSRPVPYRLDMSGGVPVGPAIMAKPFSADRDPQARQAQDIAGAGGDVTSSPPRLVGLVGRVKGPGVALVQLPDGTTSVVAAGEQAAGWTVEAVGRDSITFSNGGNRQVVKLDYGNRQDGQPSPAAVATQP